MYACIKHPLINSASLLLSKHGPLKTFEVGSGAMEELALSADRHTCCVFFVVFGKTEKYVANQVISNDLTISMTSISKHATQGNILFVDRGVVSTIELMNVLLYYILPYIYIYHNNSFSIVNVFYKVQHFDKRLYIIFRS